MARLEAMSYQELAVALTQLGFAVAGRQGAHVRFAHPDGRSTTVPHHGDEAIRPGLLQRIVHDAAGQ